MNLKRSISAISVAYVTIMLISYFYTFQFKGISYGEAGFLREEFPFVILLASMMIGYLVKKRKDLPLKINFTTKEHYFLFGGLPLLSTLLFFWIEHFQLTWTFFIPFIATLCIGIGEELLFRRVLLPYFLKHFSTHKAVALSSVCFGFFHAINVFAGSTIKTVLLQVLVTTLFGFYYAYLYLFTRKITWCAIDHGLWDYLVFSTATKTHPILLGAIVLQQMLRIGLAIFMAQRVRKYS